MMSAMPPRRGRKKRTYRRKTWSLINALESYVYASIITEGTLGTSPWGFITGQQDAGYVAESQFGTGAMSYQNPDQVISLQDIIANPSEALGAAASNFSSKLIPMAIQSALTSMTFRLGKRLLRRPLANVNRTLVKPALGAGIRL